MKKTIAAAAITMFASQAMAMNINSMKPAETSGRIDVTEAYEHTSACQAASETYIGFLNMIAANEPLPNGSDIIADAANASYAELASHMALDFALRSGTLAVVATPTDIQGAQSGFYRECTRYIKDVAAKMSDFNGVEVD